jgi:hypothetical protein
VFTQQFLQHLNAGARTHIYCFKSYGNKHTNGSAKSDAKFLNKLHLRAVVVAAPAAAATAAPAQMNRIQSTPKH